MTGDVRPTPDAEAPEEHTYAGAERAYALLPHVLERVCEGVSRLKLGKAWEEGVQLPKSANAPLAPS